MKRILSCLLIAGLIFAAMPPPEVCAATASPIQLRNKTLEVLEAYRVARNQLIANKNKTKSKLLYKNKLTILNNKIKYLETEYARQAVVAKTYEKKLIEQKKKAKEKAAHQAKISEKAPAKKAAVKKPAVKKAAPTVPRRPIQLPPATPRPISRQFAVETISVRAASTPAQSRFLPVASKPLPVRRAPAKPKGPSLASRFSVFSVSLAKQASTQWERWRAGTNRLTSEASARLQEGFQNSANGINQFRVGTQEWVSGLSKKWAEWRESLAIIKQEMIAMTPAAYAPVSAHAPAELVSLPPPPYEIVLQKPKPAEESESEIIPASAVELTEEVSSSPAQKAALTGKDWVEMDEAYKALHLLSIMGRLIHYDIIAWKSQSFYAKAIDDAITKEPLLQNKELAGIFLDQLEIHEPDAREAVGQIRKEF